MPSRVERSACARSVPFRPREPSVDRRHFGITERREIPEQVVPLEDEPEVLATKLGELVRLHRAGLAARHAVGSRRRPIEAAENVHQRGLARARLPDDRHHLAGVNVEVHALERVNDRRHPPGTAGRDCVD